MKNKYLQILKSTLLLSAFTFGGGYVIIPLMKKKFVDELQWINDDEILDLISIAQTTPGAVAVNASIVIGYKIGGFIGAFLAIVGTIIPPLIIITAISYFYNEFKHNLIISLFLKSMQAAITIIIFDVVYKMSKKLFSENNSILILILIISFISVYFFKVSIPIIILCCILFSILNSILKGVKKC